jgi:hypothetical protein
MESNSVVYIGCYWYGGLGGVIDRRYYFPVVCRVEA